MVSLRCLVVAAFVLVSVSSVSATFNLEPTPICKCHNDFYASNGLELNGVLNGVAGLVQGIFKKVGFVLQTVNNLLSGIFGFLNFNKNKVHDINSFLVKPKSNGDLLSFYLKLITLGHPVYNKVNIGLGDIYVKVASANLIIAASLRGKSYDGLNFNLLTGPKSQWVSQLGLNTIGNDWQTHCNSFGGIKSLSGPKLVIYTYINLLVQNLVIGVDNIVDDLLNVVLETVSGLTCLVSNLVDNLFNETLNVLVDYSSNLLINKQSSSFRNSISTTVQTYDSSYYSECFSS